MSKTIITMKNGIQGTLTNVTDITGINNDDLFVLIDTEDTKDKNFYAGYFRLEDVISIITFDDTIKSVMLSGRTSTDD